MRGRKYLFAMVAVLALLARMLVAEVVFSEIMYHPKDAPDGTDGNLFEYIELYNNGSVPESLTGAYFSKGITYTFSSSVPTVLNPGEYLVVVKDRAAFQSRYPDVVNLADGVYSGSLDNNGEKVNLKIGGTTVSVRYETANAWPAASDGFGPSLERYCMTSSDVSGVNWAASGAPTDWQLVSWTGRIDSASIQIAFFLDFDGKCLLDDVSLKAVGSATELVANGTFESGMTGWSAAGNHSQSRTEPGLGANGGAALAIQCNESRWYLNEAPYSQEFYGDGEANRVVSSAISVTPGADYVVSWWVRRSGIGGTLFGVMGGVTKALALGSQGTPGRANSVSTSFLPIGVTNVAQACTLCPVGTGNVIRANVSAPADVSRVEVLYQIVHADQYRFTDGSYSNLVMRDDGVAPDTAAGDGNYAVSMPPINSERTLLRYHVVATAKNGFQARNPRLDDPSADYAYWVESSPTQTRLPNWQLLVDGDPILYPVSRHICAISPDGQIFTDVMARHRGNVSGGAIDRSGIGIHFHTTKKYDAWFAAGQKIINIRHRLNDWYYFYRRVVAEPLAYDLQRTIGLPTPRFRFICVWINGYPTITTELEAPGDDFLSDNGISSADFVSRQTYSDRREVVGGNPALDNFDSVMGSLYGLSSDNRTAFIKANLCYESIQHCLALLSLTGNGDQQFDWNMMQHRSASDGRWRQYPWDVDMSFDMTFSNGSTALTSLHPYYQTPLHPNIWNPSYANPLGSVFFAPEEGDETTLPYRYRHQVTLWRYCSTLYTTNYLFPKLDAIQATLAPAYSQISEYFASGEWALNEEVNDVKNFIVSRRNFLMNGEWSDKMADVWNPANVYTPSNVVISEIMHSPAVGGKYIELFNRGSAAVDLSHWSLSAGGVAAYLPFGTMIAPTSFVVLAASQTALTNAYVELGDPGLMVERYVNTGIWDWPIVFTSATEYASRIVEIPLLDFQPSGSTIELRDVTGTLIDGVAYANTPPWPDGAGVALERIDPGSADTSASAWRASVVVGTPGVINTASGDVNADAIPDVWEQQIIAASGGAFTDISQILPADDFDADGLCNLDEFLLGTNPVSPDPELASLVIGLTNGQVFVSFPTIPATGSAYSGYRGRFYTVLRSTNLLDAAWSVVPDYSGRAAGGPIVFTNAVQPFEAYRFEAELRPIRP